MDRTDCLTPALPRFVHARVGTTLHYPDHLCRFLLRPLRVVSTVQVFSSEASDSIPPPPPDGASKTYPEKIHTLVQEISHLSLLETAQLNELLKVRMILLFRRAPYAELELTIHVFLQTTLNIPDAPVMMGAMPTAAATQGVC